MTAQLSTGALWRGGCEGFSWSSIGRGLGGEWGRNEISKLGASEKTARPAPAPLVSCHQALSQGVAPAPARLVFGSGQVLMPLYEFSWHQEKQKMGLWPVKLTTCFNMSLAGSSAEQVRCSMALFPLCMGHAHVLTWSGHGQLPGGHSTNFRGHRHSGDRTGD